MKEQPLEKTIEPAPPATARFPRPVATAPTVFRRQERFWKEVRQHIAEKNPAVPEAADRLY